MVNVKRLAFLALGVVALSAGSCAKSEDIRPTLRIVSPENGSTLNTSSIFLRIAVTNFTLTSAPDNGEPFIGRWHLYIDGANGVAITTTSATIAEIPPGQHTFYAELANQNDTPINGVAVDSVTLDFPATAPQLTMSAPQPNGLYNSSSVEAALQVANFTLDSANIGAANIAGHGHYHVYVGGLDAPLRDEDALSTLTVTDLGAAFATTSTGWSSRGPGAHRVRVELRSNTGSSLAPNVADKARIVVP